MPSYADAVASGPYVDVTVWGPYRTIPLPPAAARKFAREVLDAADATERPPTSEGPGLAIVLTANEGVS